MKELTVQEEDTGVLTVTLSFMSKIRPTRDWFVLLYDLTCMDIQNKINMQTNEQISKYRTKYKSMKERIKSLVLENAALCDEVAHTQERIQIVKDERKFLLRKLLEYENDTDQYLFRNDPNYFATDPKKPRKRRSHEDCVKGILTQAI